MTLTKIHHSHLPKAEFTLLLIVSFTNRASTLRWGNDCTWCLSSSPVNAISDYPLQEHTIESIPLLHPIPRANFPNDTRSTAPPIKTDRPQKPPGRLDVKSAELSESWPCTVCFKLSWVGGWTFGDPVKGDIGLPSATAPRDLQ